MKIGIFGSAPNAQLLDCDVGYFANFSGQSFDQEALAQRVAKRVCLMSVTARFPKRKKQSFVPYEKSIALVAGNLAADFDQLIVLALEKPADDYKDQLSKDETFLEFAQTQALLQEMIEKKPPYFRPRHFCRGLLKRPSKALRILIKSKLNKEKLPPYFRPSMGVMALAYAVSQHEDADTEFVVSGMSFSSRESHAIHGEVASAVDWFAAHVEADKYCVDQLLRGRSIQFA